MKGRETRKFRWKNVYYKRGESYYYESLLLRRNFDHRILDGKSANGRKKFWLELWYFWRSIVACTENDNISWSGGQVWMNSSDARDSCWTDNWKSLSHISIRRIGVAPSSSSILVCSFVLLTIRLSLTFLPVDIFTGERIKLRIFGKAFLFLILFVY